MSLGFICYPPALNKEGATKIQKLHETARKNPQLWIEADHGEMKQELIPEAQVLADALFSRAPGDFLERASVNDLVDIAVECTLFFRRFRNNSSKPLVEFVNPRSDSNRGELSTFFTALSDRPFVIDSIQEFLKAKKIRHHVFLHPILKEENGSLTSLTYTELDRIDDPKLAEEVRTGLEKVLEEVVLVTDDFGKMARAVGETTANLRTRLAEDNLARELEELGDWLCKGGFVLIGAEMFSTEGGEVRSLNRPLGLFRSPHERHRLNQVMADVGQAAAEGLLFSYTKISTYSPVHRRQRLDCLVFQGATEHQFLALLGLPTTRTVSQDIQLVPILRNKLSAIIEAEGLFMNSHDYKEVLSFLNSLPKSDLFQFSIDALREDIHLMMGIQRRSESRVSVRPHSGGRFLAIHALVPKERFSSSVARRIARMLEERFDLAKYSVEYRSIIVEDHLATIAYIVPLLTSELPDFDELKQEIAEGTLTWDDKLFFIVENELGAAAATKLLQFYADALPEPYKSVTAPDEAYFDIQMLESLSTEREFELAIRVPENFEPSNPVYDLRIYRRGGGGLSLSSTIPVLENAGFTVLHEDVNQLLHSDHPWAVIYNLQVRPYSGLAIEPATIGATLLPGLRAILGGAADNDGLNALLVSPGLHYPEVAIARTITNYLFQIRAIPSKQVLISALTENPGSARLLIHYFHTKFDPNLKGNRADLMEEVRASFVTSLKQISSLAYDRALQAAFNVVDACVRTNYFVERDEQVRIALKIDCAKINRMPEPRPMFEIYVAAPRFEGVHLRGGKVARGGLRWSERPEDFRTEILGLMKTQMVKNTIIVPVGAKGGFVLKRKCADRADLMREVESCYRLFITSLLEITDNRVENDIVHPTSVVVHDAPDPYFVVAADKGTAGFSDVANEIAQARGFWLADAFASGGSLGYSHKAFAITARGAWETACRHFREMGKDPNSEEFTCVGIGDMSGDVFGNGLLRSRKTKLLAAFDHRHIFVDPNPDPERSFKERQRLFSLPSSSWMDYDKGVLSPGGGIFNRSDKEIRLANEVREALGIQQEVLSGQELVRAILLAPVDLLWNGGIGTYVKASTEENLSVADRANDDVRVDAKDIRAKVIAEGGNLGLTQLARIEFSACGGHCNTDAIDNSGGVDLSDLEVNLKILLSDPLKHDKLSFAERNSLLSKVADEVCLKVTSRNRSQSEAISLTLLRSKQRMTGHIALIHRLEKDGRLNRKQEQLPDDAALSERSLTRKGLYRPELAVLVAYAKMDLFEFLLGDSLIDDPHFERILFGYFPAAVTDRFPEEIRRHPLRREIIATQLANLVVESMGPAFVERFTSESACNKHHAIKAFCAAEAIIGLRELHKQLEALDTASNSKDYLQSLIRLSSAIDGSARWIVDNLPEDFTLVDVIKRHRETFQELATEVDDFIPATDQSTFDREYRHYVAVGLEPKLAKGLAGLVYAAALLDVTDISLEYSLPVRSVAQGYALLGSELRITKLLQETRKLELSDPWELAARQAIMADLRKIPGAMLRSIIKGNSTSLDHDLRKFIDSRTDSLKQLHDSIRALEGSPLNIPTLVVVTKQLQRLTQ